MENKKHDPKKRITVPRKRTNRIADAELIGKKEEVIQVVEAPVKEQEILNDRLAEETLKEDPQSRFAQVSEGEVNAPPLQFSEDELKEFQKEEQEKDKKRLEITSQTTTYDNGSNVWKLIAKTYNDYLGYDHTTSAMQIGVRGVLVCVKEAVGQKSDSTTTFIPGATLEMLPAKNEFGDFVYDEKGMLEHKWGIR